MNRSDETLFDPRIASWLEADPNTAPEPVLEVVLAALPAIKQRRAWHLPWWPALPRTLLAQATLVGVVLLAVAVGFGIWSGGRNLVVPHGGSPTQSPSPSFEGPTQSPSPSFEAPTPSPSPTHSPSPSPFVKTSTYPTTETFVDSVLGWPDNSGSNEPGLYSWDGRRCEGRNCLMGVLHNHGSEHDVRISIDRIPERTISDASATPVTVAGHQGLYLHISPQLEEWNVDFDGTLLSISLSAEPGVSQADVDDAHSIIESLVYEQRDTALGFRLVFSLETDEWDSPF